LNAVPASACAAIAGGTFAKIPPTTLPGGKPTIAVPGETPISPIMLVGLGMLLVFVIFAVPAKTANEKALPSGTP